MKVVFVLTLMAGALLGEPDNAVERKASSFEQTPQKNPAARLDRSRLPGRQVKVAAICRQGATNWDQTAEQFQARLRLALDSLDCVGNQGVDIACFGEYFASREAERVPGPIVGAVAEMAKKHGMYVVCNVRERAGDKHYNTAVLIDRQGRVAGKYRKAYPFFGERVVPGPADAAAFDTDFGRISVITCFDSNFPELWNDADIRGVELVFWISGGGGGVWLNAYATLHNYYVVAVGNGQIADITGKDRTDVRALEKGIYLATLDLDRTFVHNNFNVPKIEKLLAEHKREVELERRYNDEGWYLLRSTSPGIRVRDLCKKYGIEVMRDYRNHSRAAVDKARLAGEEVPLQEKSTVAMLQLEGDRFTAKLPWFYHGLAFDKPREHDIYSFETNALPLEPDDYMVVLAPKGKPAKLAVGFDGVTFQERPVRDGRVKLPSVGIHNRMLSLYVRGSGKQDGGPLESVYIYPADSRFDKARDTAVPFTVYHRNTQVERHELLRPAEWAEFRDVLNRKSFGKRQLHEMFGDILDWCKRRQELDPKNPHYGAIYSEEDKYDFRDAAAAAVCFAYAWRDTGNDDYRRRALLARNYVYKGQHLEQPSNLAQYGAFCQMTHGGMQRLSGKLGAAVGVETAIIINLLAKTYELGLEPSPEDLRHLRAAAVWMANSEFAKGVFRHHEGATWDCQASNAMAVAALMRAYQALEKLGQNPPYAWLDAAKRGMAHFLEGQEAIGSWPYIFATIGRGQAFHRDNIPPQGMGVCHFLVGYDTPTFRGTPAAKEAMRRAARWWLCMSHIDRRGPLPTIDLDDRGVMAKKALNFWAFTWCRFMAAASLIRIADYTGEGEPWRQLALCYMEHVRTKLWNTSDPDKAPVRRATADFGVQTWIQAAEWEGVLLRDMEEHLPHSESQPINERYQHSQ